MRALRVLLGAAALIAAAPALSQHFQPPPVVAVDPGPGGRRVTDDGLIANYYPAAKPGAGAILLLGGSEGGIGAGLDRQARDFAAHGFAVMELGYFGLPGLPLHLDRVPLEYFDRALGWLARQPGIDRDRLAVIGASKGAEAALLVASRHPELGAVVVGMPSAVAWPGLDFSGGPVGSSWSVGGKPLPDLAYGEGARSIFDAYRSGLETLAQHPEARIPVERITAPILLVCGRDDSLWPSCPMAELVKQTAPRATVLAYDHAGHALFGPPLAAGNPALPSLASLGGTPQGNNAARADGWPRVLAFLQRTIGRR
jgi:hypothetical protein